MKLAYDLATDRFAEPEPQQGNKALASWYAPGLSDELGDRLLMFDNSSAPSLELLRFRRALMATPGFEVALRRRVERLSHFRHPSFATVRAVEYLGPGDGLALVSNHMPGKRLSEVLKDARGPAFATALIQQITPALASLRQFGEGTGHGALAADRIIITPEGRLMIVEHVLGPALERLQLSAERLRNELGIAVPAGSHLKLDRRTDDFQLGLIALSLLLGRRVNPNESQENIARLLEQVARTANRESGVLFRRLRLWLERALQIKDQVFDSSGDAQDALDDLSDIGLLSALHHQPLRAVAAQTETGRDAATPAVAATDGSPADRDRAYQPPRSVQNAHPEIPAVLPHAPLPDRSEPIEALFLPEHTKGEAGTMRGDTPVGASEAHVRAQRHEPIPPDPAQSHERPSSSSKQSISARPDRDARAGSSLFIEIDPRGVQANVPPQSPGRPRPAPRRTEKAPTATLPQTKKPARLGAARLLVAGLALCVLAQGAVIASLVLRGRAAALPALVVETSEPGADVLVDGRSAGVTPLQLNVGAGTRSIRVVDSRLQRSNTEARLDAGNRRSESRVTTPAKPDLGAADLVAAVPQRTGGIRVASPIEIEVFEGDKRLGSSATGIVSVPVGRHELELVNSVLGYRTRQVVDVKSGRVVSVGVSPPHGRVAINAQPWAEVWIDGKSVGETPLGNLSVPLGQHEILFRHPQLGEQRQSALVRMNVVTRVSANLQR